MNTITKKQQLYIETQILIIYSAHLTFYKRGKKNGRSKPVDGESNQKQ